nr:MAG TPA: hypothetical protein [Caudoviricetes sp.]
MGSRLCVILSSLYSCTAAQRSSIAIMLGLLGKSQLIQINILL